MPKPEQNPTDPRPDQAPNAPATADQDTNRDEATPETPDAAPDQASPQPTSPQPTSTQQNMGDGAGIRGNYGDASQTNGLEGGPDQGMTDTELTGS